MPYKRKYKGKRRFVRRTRRRTTKKKYRVSTRKLADKRINTLVEKRMQAISKSETKKLIAPNIIFRRTIWGAYDRITNQFGAGTAVDMDGLIVHMCQLPLQDDATSVTVVPSSDNALIPAVPDYQKGVNSVAPIFPADGMGYRTGAKVQIQNLGCSLRFYLPPAPDGAPARQPTQTCKYAIVAVSDVQAFTLQWKPQIDEVLPFKGLGFSSRIDNQITDASNDGQPRRVLARGSITLRQATGEQGWYVEKFRKLYKALNQSYEFQSQVGGTAADQNGQRVVSKWKLFLCLRNDIPAAAGEEYKMRVSGFMKCGFRNGR